MQADTSGPEACEAYISMYYLLIPYFVQGLYY